ncbi:SUMF1/EgtB/PvdO family nonheme iron enzyme [Spiroplasma taiwanense]|uniref:Sulfatase-modifying factor 1 n=1 Tax=Spiroplasma taiwanense CT-1 TaxID=1276220 RepID=S5LW81_9MOLU|nr:SUMF1/EgtB/PvdO family nonheme iron enzyme [Spiroplasma taiwanense]AGR40861.1 sulfatase-modifying factor 1 [Spiroplasma taiwanense CT-1]
MIKINEKEFLIGNNDFDGKSTDFESPPKMVKVESFWIDETSVTNQMFKEFVDETNYLTEAEKVGYSYVFHLQLTEETKKNNEKLAGLDWWYEVNGAFWKCPYGPNSNIDNILDHPVVHVSKNEAVEYCKWAKKRLPTEAEWELAARGGKYNTKFPWGNEKKVENKWMLNIFQGNFPYENTLEDGYLGTSPCTAFPPNSYGIYQMLGNVWEWC